MKRKEFVERSAIANMAALINNDACGATIEACARTSVDAAYTLADVLYGDTEEAEIVWGQAFDDLCQENGWTMEEKQARQIRLALEIENWNRKRAAERLGISERTLYRLLKKLKIERDE